MFGGFFPGMPGFPGATFEARYRAMPVAFIDKQSAEYGDKIIMPPSALDQLGASRCSHLEGRAAAQAQARLVPARCLAQSVHRSVRLWAFQHA